MVVLCSYKGSSNFLSALTNIFREVIRKDIIRKIEGLKQSLDFSFLDECDIYSHSSKVRDDNKETFFNNMIEERIKTSQISFENKTKVNDENNPFPVLMAFFTFVICVAVLFIDSMCFNSIFGSFILFLFDIVFLVITIAGWVDYWKDNLHLTDNVRNKLWFLLFAAIIVLITLLVKMPIYAKIVLLSTAILSCSVYLYNHFSQKRKNDDFNIRYIAKYEIKWMSISTIISVAVYIAFYGSLLYEIMPIWIKHRCDVIMENYTLVESGIFVWRSLFIVLCALNAFILPL